MILLNNLALNWIVANPVIPNGEFALEIDTQKVKLGDGQTPWNKLKYFGGNLTNQTFTGEFNLTTSFQTSYSKYTLNSALTPTISSDPLVGANARVCIDAGASASLVTTNIGIARPGSDSFTTSKLNEIVIFKEEEALYYNIRVLN
jgi:hypothetical protein